MKNSLNDLKVDLINSVKQLYNTERKKSIKNILEVKINIEAPNPESRFNSFFNSIKKDYNDIILENLIGHQFPCYLAVLYLPDSKDNMLTRRVSLIICISLLVDYYTIYVEDSFFFAEYIDKASYCPSFCIQSLDSNQKLTNEFKIEKIKTKVNNFFPSKKYISHYLLNNWMLKGFIPYGYSEHEVYVDEEYSLYQLLFDSVSASNFINKEVLK